MDEQDQPYRCCDEFEEYQRQQWTLRQSRANFLKTTVGAMAVAPLMPEMFLKKALAQHLKLNGAGSDPILVVVQLGGGNDGLNMIVPYGSGLYYQDRPNINVPADKVIQLDKVVGLNPNLQALKPLYDAGKLAILQGVGYPNPDRSHFRSTQIWQTADPTTVESTGWLGRYLDTALASDNNPLKAVALGPLVPITLAGQRTTVPAIESINTFRFAIGANYAKGVLNAYKAMYDGSTRGLPEYLGLVKMAGVSAEQGVTDLQSVATAYKPNVTYPTNQLGRELQLVAQIIATGLGTRIFHVSLGGFDDHAAEVYTHANLMKVLGDSLAAFYQDMQDHGHADQIVIMTYSEFGRRVRENASRGTDHGTAAPMLVLGGKVKGGVYGDDPILSNLDGNGDLKFGIDFRSTYSTLLQGWMGGDPKAVLGGTFERLPFL